MASTGAVTLAMVLSVGAAPSTAAAAAPIEESIFVCPGEGGRVVRLGDPLIDHKDKCGSPKVSQRMEKERVGLKARHVSGGNNFIEERDISIEVEEWYIERPNHRPRILRFENGRLASISITKLGVTTTVPKPAPNAAAATASAPTPVDASAAATTPDDAAK